MVSWRLASTQPRVIALHRGSAVPDVARTRAALWRPCHQAGANPRARVPPCCASAQRIERSVHELGPRRATSASRPRRHPVARDVTFTPQVWREGLVVALLLRVRHLRAAEHGLAGGSGVIEGVDVNVTSRARRPRHARRPEARLRARADNRTAPAPNRTAPAPNRTAPAPNRRGPAPNRTAPAPNRRGPAPNRRGPAPNRTAPAPNRRGPAPNRRGPAPNRTAPAPNRRGPAPNRTAPAPNRRGPAPNRTAPAPNRRGPAPNRRGPAPNRTAPAPNRIAHLVR